MAPASLSPGHWGRYVDRQSERWSNGLDCENPTSVLEIACIARERSIAALTYASPPPAHAKPFIPFIALHPVAKAAELQ
ncbi:hypothetical protein SDJN02_01215, partial [Cucurbita argyrosperma subsp. argyrosperma]